MVKSSPRVSPKPRFGPNLDLTDWTNAASSAPATGCGAIQHTIRQEQHHNTTPHGMTRTTPQTTTRKTTPPHLTTIKVARRRCVPPNATQVEGDGRRDGVDSPPRLAFTRYCYYQYFMLNGTPRGAGGNCILRNMDCKIQGGGCNKGGVKCQEQY